jgi:hypothetical protein
MATGENLKGFWKQGVFIESWVHRFAVRTSYKKDKKLGLMYVGDMAMP